MIRVINKYRVLLNTNANICSIGLINSPAQSNRMPDLTEQLILIISHSQFLSVKLLVVQSVADKEDYCQWCTFYLTTKCHLLLDFSKCKCLKLLQSR